MKKGEKKMDANVNKVKLIGCCNCMKFGTKFLPLLKKIGIHGGVR